MQLWENLGCLPEKLVMGMAFYGRTFTLADDQNHAIDSPIKTGSEGGTQGIYTQSAGFLAYYELCVQFKNNSWTKEWDPIGMCPYMYEGIYVYND